MFPCLDDNTIIRNLPWQEKLPAYLAEIKDMQVRRGDEMVWWRRHKLSQPHWSSAAYNLALVQPSSAAAERVFSILRSHFDYHQAGALLLMREHCRALFHFLSTKRALNAQKMGDAPSTKSLKNEHYLHRPNTDSKHATSSNYSTSYLTTTSSPTETLPTDKSVVWQWAIV